MGEEQVSIISHWISHLLVACNTFIKILQAGAMGRVWHKRKECKRLVSIYVNGLEDEEKRRVIIKNSVRSMSARGMKDTCKT